MTGGNVFTSVTSSCRLRRRRRDLFVRAAGGRGAKLGASNSSLHHLCSRHSEPPPRAATECQRSIRRPVNANFHFLSLWHFFPLSFSLFFLALFLSLFSRSRFNFDTISPLCFDLLKWLKALFISHFAAVHAGWWCQTWELKFRLLTCGKNSLHARHLLRRGAIL